jgi:hypothetical protein
LEANDGRGGAFGGWMEIDEQGLFARISVVGVKMRSGVLFSCGGFWVFSFSGSNNSLKIIAVVKSGARVFLLAQQSFDSVAGVKNAATGEHGQLYCDCATTIGDVGDVKN